MTVWEGGDASDRTPFPQPVGGIIVPVNKLGLLALRPVSEAASGQAPWLGLVGLASLIALTVALVRRRRD